MVCFNQMNFQFMIYFSWLISKVTNKFISIVDYNHIINKCMLFKRSCLDSNQELFIRFIFSNSLSRQHGYEFRLWYSYIVLHSILTISSSKTKNIFQARHLHVRKDAFVSSKTDNMWWVQYCSFITSFSVINR